MPESAYFDNAATTFPKPEAVYSDADALYRTLGGNAGRGSSPFSNQASGIVSETRDLLKGLYSCHSKEIAFTSTATEALNRILLGAGLSHGDSVYLTPFEHNAVTRPANHLAKDSGIDLQLLKFDKTSLLPSLDEIEAQFIQKKPSLVALTHASNVCGAVVPVLEICKLAKRFDAITVVDMSQTAGLLDLELSNEAIDFAVFAGHKTLYGPFGVGGFFFSRHVHLSPILFGGNGINSIEQEMPTDIIQMTEIGSRNIYAIAGLRAALAWIQDQGLQSVRELETRNADRLLSLMRSYSGIRIVGDSMECERIGVVSALFQNYSPSEIEQIMGNQGISIRSGLHCSPYAHKFLGTIPEGTARFSVSALTTDRDFEMLHSVLDGINEEG